MLPGSLGIRQFISESKHSLGVKVGYSDHADGVEVPIVAVALEASTIMKHFSLNHSMSEPNLNKQVMQ